MKKLLEFKVICSACKTHRTYAVTQSDLGRVDCAITRWCVCSEQDLVLVSEPAKQADEPSLG